MDKKENKNTYDIEKLYVVEIGKIKFKDSKRDTISINTSRKQIALSDNDKFIDVLNSQIYYLWNQTTYSFKEEHMNSYYVYNYDLLEWSEYKTSKTKLTENDIREIVSIMNDEKQEEKQKTSKHEIKDPVLNMILDTKEMINFYEISEDKKSELEEKLCNCGNQYVTELKRIMGDNYTSLRWILIKKIATIVASIEIEIISYPKKYENLIEDTEEFNKQFKK